jgi:hypothetical protein
VQGDVGFSILMYETLRNVVWAMQQVGNMTDTVAIAAKLKGHRFEDGIVARMRAGRPGEQQLLGRGDQVRRGQLAIRAAQEVTAMPCAA